MSDFIDLVTVACFVCVLIAGVMLMVVQNLRGQRPDAVIHARMAAAFSPPDAPSTPDGAPLAARLHPFAHAAARHAGGRWIDARLARLRTVAHRHGPRIVVATALASVALAFAILAFVPLPGFVRPLLVLGLPALAVERVYRLLVERFRRGFLATLPDAIDLIVRAVRAGVPVTHVIPTVASECPQPLAREFGRMGDALQVGMEFDAVLETAMRRIQIADFSFFCVCLLLQRETGGQLGETLENLAGIVRSRREIRQKTRALTAESRITTKILAAVPVVVLGMLWEVNRAYVSVLLDTATGRHLFAFSVASIVLGLVVINRMANLDTSR